MGFIESLLAAGIARGTPLLIAVLGETLAERSGVMNLGLEGVMLASAMAGAGTAHATGSPMLGLCVAACVGAVFGLAHAWLTVSLRCDQVVTGLAMVFVGSGIASVGGAGLVALRQAVPHFDAARIPLLGEVPFAGHVLFGHVWLVYAAFLAVPLLHLFLTRTSWGLSITASGENPNAASAMGIDVMRLRYACVTAGGALAGVAGATLSLAVTPGWVDGLTAGQGWMAIGLVVVGGWRPVPAAAGALLLGTIQRLALDLQGLGIPLFQDPNTAYFLNMLPYLAAVLVLVAAALAKRHSRAPAALGVPFAAGDVK
jgi:simple sugar transport system permease protein